MIEDVALDLVNREAEAPNDDDEPLPFFTIRRSKRAADWCKRAEDEGRGGKRMKGLSTDQVLGVYRRNVGDIAVATVNYAAHHSAGRLTAPWLPVNTYAIETADQLKLVDAGDADIAPDAGRLLPNFVSLEVKAIDIDAILMTRLRTDGDAGLIVRRWPLVSGYCCRAAASEWPVLRTKGR